MLESFAAPLRHAAAVPSAALPLPSTRLHVAATVARGPAVATPLSGAEREALAPLARCMAHMLDEIDYGMLLVDADAQVLYLNHAARRELDRDHPLQLAGNLLVAPNTGDATALQEALAEAQRGKRRLMTLGSGEQFVGISVVPLNESDTRAGATLLVLGKRNVCEQLSVQGYARAVALTPAETRVLELLCVGVQPTVIASRQGVAVSTVRTQIGSIRAKTGANSIRELVRQVAVLPPLVGALRSSAAAFGAVRMSLAS
jgi:DNA-binding CsgD family transcriptional regulator